MVSSATFSPSSRRLNDVAPAGAGAGAAAAGAAAGAGVPACDVPPSAPSRRR